MKNWILLILLFPVWAFAQNLEGTISYEETMKLEFKLDNADKHFLSKLPTERKNHYQLLFKGVESLYKTVEGEDLEVQEETGDGHFMFKMQTPEHQVYCNHQDQYRIERKEFLGKYFLIEGTPQEWKWKLTTEAKEIQGYACQKAIFSDTSQTVTAWFSPQIPASYGPGNYGKLPGMILEMEFDEGKRIITATKVSLEPLQEKFEIPSKGKKVTQEEYNQIVDEKMKEMGATRGKGGNVKMIITRESHN